MEKIKVKIKVKEKNYDVFIGNNILSEMKDFISQNHNGKRVVVITDNIVNKLHANKLAKTLKILNPFFISVQAGEVSKSRRTKEKIEDKLFDNKFGKDTVIIAFGGGVIGDLASFVASTFNRGIPIIHVPTTILAMADSSIGGKTSVNAKHGKNLIGTVYQPAAVFTDMDFLGTLSIEEFRNGLAEIIKMSIIKDKNLFGLLTSFFSGFEGSAHSMCFFASISFMHSKIEFPNNSSNNISQLVACDITEMSEMFFNLVANC